LFDYPSVKDLAQKARNSFRAEMPGTDPWTWPSVLHVCAKVWAGITWSIYGRLKQIDRTRFMYTSKGQELDLHGAEYLIGRLPASFASGPIKVIGPTNAVIPLGTVFTRSDGLTYTATATTALSAAGQGTIYAVCSVTGAIGNCVFGTLFASVFTNAGAAAGGIGAGADIEADDGYRNRLLLRKRFIPMGGNASDYISWALSVPGITRVFVDDSGVCSVAGDVVVYIMSDITHAAGYGIPGPAEVLAVQTYLNGVAPIAANVIVRAPIAYPVDVQVTGGTLISAARQQAVSDEIAATIRRTAVVSTSVRAAMLTLPTLWSALLQAAGDQVLELASPVADVKITAGHIAFLNSVTFI